MEAQAESAPTGVQKTKTHKKKQSRRFETYIPKVLKEVLPGSGIVLNAKQQLNAAVSILAREISNKVCTLTEIAGKKTLFEKEVFNAISITLPQDLAARAIEKGKEAIDTYKDIKDKSNGSSRQAKAGIVFPPSTVEKFLRNFDRSKIMVNERAPYAFAAALEFITSEILCMAGKLVKSDKRVRITIRDLELAVRNDADFNRLFNTLNISFIGGGVVPFIHNSLLVKTKKKAKKAQPGENGKKAHRFRPGTVAVREIRKYQKSFDTLTFARSPFEQCVRNAIAKHTSAEHSPKISKEVFVIMQHYIEQYLVDILRNANCAAIHAQRRKLLPVDISFVMALRNHEPTPYSANLSEETHESEDEASAEN